MASLVDLTKRVATAPFRAVGNIAGTIGSTVKRSISGITGVGSLRPSAIAAATMEAAGVGGLIPAAMFAGGGGGGKGGGGSKNSTDPGAGSTAPTSPMVGTNNLETIMSQLVAINKEILTINQQILTETKKNTKSLNDIVTYFQNKQLADIEDRRERTKQAVQAPAGTKQEAAKTPGKGIFDALGGIFSGILGFIKDLGDIFSSVLKIGSTIISSARVLLGFFTRLGGLFLRLVGFLGGPVVAAITAVIGVLLSLKEEDWTAFAKKFTDAWDALLNGDYLTAIVNVITAIPELIIKGLGRLIANIAEFLGFDKAAKAINEWVDNFDLAKIVIDALKSIGDMIVRGFNAAKDMFTDFWNSFDIIKPITDTFNFILDSIVNLFTSLKDSVANVINAGVDIVKSISDSISSMINSVWNFFTSLPGKVVDLIGGMIPDSLKGMWNRIFGSRARPPESGPPAATPAATPPATPAAVPTGGQTALPTGAPQITPTAGITPTTPVLTSGAIPGATPTASVPPSAGITPQSRVVGASTIIAQQQALLAGLNPGQVPGLQYNVGTTQAQQRANEASRLGMALTTPAPTIVNNINNNMVPAGGGNTKSDNRTSGAAPTAPVQSHMDRALYGSTYGAGIP